MTLADQITAAKPGDTLQLQPGNNGALVLSKPVSLVGPPDAVFDSLSVNPGASGTLDHPTVLRGFSVAMAVTDTSISASYAVKVAGVRPKPGMGSAITVQHVVLDGLSVTCGRLANDAPNAVAAASDPSLPRPGERVQGQWIGIGVAASDCIGVTIQNCTIGQAMKGLGIGRSSGLRILNNTIGEIRTSPIVGASVTDTLIQGNRLGPSRPWQWGAPGGHGDHGDFIHIWTEAGFGPVTGLRILGNLLDQRDGGAILGIYLDDGAQGGGFLGVEVSRNVVLLANNQGVRFENCHGLADANIMLQPGGGAKDCPSFIMAMGSDVALTNNIAGDSARLFATRPGNIALPAGVQPPLMLELARRMTNLGGA